MSKTMYLIGDDGGAARTNNPKAAALLKAQGYRECSHEEYAKQIRRLQQEERREWEREYRQMKRAKYGLIE